MTSSAAPVAELDLTGESTPPRVLLTDAAKHLDLLRMLASQDYRSRYRSASLGLAWSVLLPLLQGVVIALVFGRLIGGGSARSYVPYVITGITIWSYMQQSVTAGSSAIVDNGQLAGRIYFPRLILPATPPSANLPGIAVSLVVAEVTALAFGAGLHASILLAPVALAVAWGLCFVVAAVTSMAHVYSRDVRYVVQAGMMLLFYATPIIYRLDAHHGVRALPHALRAFIIANPFTGVVQLLRFAFLGEADALGVAVLVTAAWLVALAVLVVAVYARRERVACDRL